MSEDERTPKPLTNGDRLRAMNNEELAGSIPFCPMRLDYECPSEIDCQTCLLNWLNSPAESEVNHESEPKFTPGTWNVAGFDSRIKELRNLYQMGFAWLSLEPLLGPIDMQLQYIAPEDLPFDWVVVGAESGANRRPCKLEWVESIVRQCRKAGIKVFVKQLDIDGELVKDIAKFPPELQIRQVPWNAEEAKYEK